MLDWLKDFKAPETAVELLERALEWAQDEDRWIAGTLFDPKVDNVLDLPDEEVCENVGACAMGIILIAAGDGPVVKSFLGDPNNEDELGPITLTESVSNPAAEKAVRALAAALSYDGEQYLTLDMGISSCESAIMTINDSKDLKTIESTILPGTSYLDPDSYDKSKHHGKIVRGFEDALQIAKDKRW
jgi:hypothetical protein